MSASLRRSSTSAVATLPVSWLDACSSSWSRTWANGGIFCPPPPAAACCFLTCVVERAQLLVGRLDGAVLVLDELLDHRLRLDLLARLVGADALRLDRLEQLVGRLHAVLLGEVGELGLDGLVGDLEPAGLRLLEQQLGVDEVVGGLLAERLLVGVLATHLRLGGRLLEGRLVDRDELLLGHLLAVDLGHDVGDGVEVGLGALGGASRHGRRRRAGRGVLEASLPASESEEPDAAAGGEGEDRGDREGAEGRVRAC